MNIALGIAGVLLSVLIMVWLSDRAPDGEDLGDMGVYIGPKEDEEEK